MPSTESAPLAPEVAAKLTQFARACKTAVRAVSLYPGAHPAIRTSLTRLVDVSDRVTSNGSFALTVLPNSLLVDGSAAARPDSSVGELAAILHRHRIGSLVLQRGADGDSWRWLMLLLVRDPEEVRAEGGIAKLWATTGGPSIDIRELDYAEILSEKLLGKTTTLDVILANCLKGEFDEPTVRGMIGLVGNVDELRAFAGKILSETAGGGPAAQAGAFLQVLRALMEHVVRTQPEDVAPVLQRLGEAAAQLPPEAMIELLKRRDSPEAAVGSENVVGALVQHMSDATKAEFVVGSLVREGGATARLAEVFQALVPELDHQRQLLSLVQERAAESELGKDGGFENFWKEAREILASYSDASYVSDAYGRELSGARVNAVEVEHVADDPPERIATWLSTVKDAVIRSLDLQLLLDLLTLQLDSVQWCDFVDTVVDHIEDLVRIGSFEPARQLALTIAEVAGDQGDPVRQPYAIAAVERLAKGPMLTRAVTSVRTGGDEDFEKFKQLCNAMGPLVIDHLVEALSIEQDARARRRLCDILLGFGAKGRESVRKLMNAANWEVRRTAVYLLREFGGADAIASLEPLLNDSEPLVQREAIHAIILIGEDRAYEALVRALTTGASRTRNALLQELIALRDSRAAPLFCYLVRHLSRRGATYGTYLASIEALGTTQAPQVLNVLKESLYRGEWWAPIRTRTLRAAAATALGRIGSAEATSVLREASKRGTRGVRAAANAELNARARKA